MPAKVSGRGLRSALHSEVSGKEKEKKIDDAVEDVHDLFITAGL